MRGLLFTYVLTYGGAVVALFNPFFGLLIYICFSIIRPEALWSWSLPGGGHFSRIVAVAALGGWALQGFGNWNLGRSRVVVVALLGYWAWAALGAVFAPNQLVAWHFVTELTKVVLLFLVGITLIDSVQKLKQLAWVMVLSATYLAYECHVAYYTGFYNLDLIGFASYGSNGLSCAMVSCAGLAFFLGLYSRNWFTRILAFGAAALMAHVPMMALSRGGILALIVTGGVSFLLIRKQPKHYVYLALAVLVGLRLAGESVREHFLSAFADVEQRDASAQSRFDLWEDCWDVVTKSPVMGTGPDHWPLLAESYGWPAGKEAHSTWLQTAAELGFPGMGLLLAFYSSCVWRLWQGTRITEQTLDPWTIYGAPMVIASLAGFSVAAIFITFEGLELPFFVTLLGAGILKLAASRPATTQHAVSATGEFERATHACAVS